MVGVAIAVLTARRHQIGYSGYGLALHSAFIRQIPNISSFTLIFGHAGAGMEAKAILISRIIAMARLVGPVGVATRATLTVARQTRRAGEHSTGGRQTLRCGIQVELAATVNTRCTVFR